ncbi:hypothetical protein XU18_1590 [Perkinsela sp. CCAP 1560/4]|nr:hypothetical protein XU18_1590 [Perkinsela sp. CCAP 1560/4]|eukprot:KNH07780.1 hypothetical protein XU18_1590 [Perkinsela sp. CCAP 1560/4]
MQNAGCRKQSVPELLQSISSTFNREIADFEELSFADIATLLYSRGLISENDTLKVIKAGRLEAVNDIQLALVKQQQHEELISVLLAPGPIRFFSTSMELPFDNIKQSYIDAVSNKRRLLAAFMHLPLVNHIHEITEKSVSLTLSEKEKPNQTQNPEAPRYMTRASHRVARPVSNPSHQLEKELRSAISEMTPEEKCSFTYMRSSLEGEKASLDSSIKRKEQFLNELKQISHSAKSDIDFDKRILNRIRKGW